MERIFIMTSWMIGRRERSGRGDGFRPVGILAIARSDADAEATE
jgi:hypothetical protein